MQKEVKLEVKNLYKIFGPHPKKAMKLLEEGLDKDAIFEKTETTVGVQDASFEILKGEIFVIMGLSGSGKSTMVRMLNRLIEPTAGQVLIDGEDIVAMSEEELDLFHDFKVRFTVTLSQSYNCIQPWINPGIYRNLL